MQSERELWRAAVRASRLDEGELERLALACGQIPNLERRLTVLLAALQADLAGPFLRSLAAELDRHDDPRDARLSVALIATLNQVPLPARGEATGDG